MSGFNVTFTQSSPSVASYLDRQSVRLAQIDEPLFRDQRSLAESVSLKGDKAIFVSSRGKIVGIDAETRKELWLQEMESGTKPDFSPAISPAGNFFAFSDNRNNIQMMDAETGEWLWKKSLSLPASGGGVRLESLRSAPAFSPDGQSVAVGTESGKILLFETQTGAYEREVDSGASASSSTPVFSPDGKRIAATFWNSDDMRHHLVMFNLSSGEKLWDEKVYFGSVLPLSFSPDGSKVIVGAGEGSDEGMLGIRSAADGKLLWEQKMPQRIASPPVFSSDGKNIHVPLWDRTLHMALVDASNGRVVAEDDASGECLWRPSTPVIAGAHVRMAAVSGDPDKKSLKLELYDFPSYQVRRQEIEGTVKMDVEGVPTLGSVPV